MRRVAIALILLAMAGCVEGPEVTAPASAKVEPDCKVGAIVDGDTFGLSCQGKPELLVRLRGVDAPEIDEANCPAERERGLVARDRLQNLIAAAPITAVRYGERHFDGRRLVDLEVGGTDLGRAMVAAGAARRFAGEVYPDWCASN